MSSTGKDTGKVSGGAGAESGVDTAAKPLRVVVTGGSGRIGLGVVGELVRRGHSVVNVDRRQSRDRRERVRFVYADTTRREQIQPALEGADAVIHLAEIPHASAPFSPDHIFSHNVTSAAVVLQTAADLGLRRAIYTSTCQVYGCWDEPRLPPERLPFDETLPLSPRNVYALSKVANERFAEFVAERSGMPIATFRLPWVTDFGTIGAGQWAWIANSPARAADGMATYLHVSDAARAYALAVESDRPGYEAYHFTAAEVLTLRPLAEQLAGYGGWPELPADWPPFRSPVRTDKARRHFGWEPRWNALDQYRDQFGREPSPDLTPKG